MAGETKHTCVSTACLALWLRSDMVTNQTDGTGYYPEGSGDTEQWQKKWRCRNTIHTGGVDPVKLVNEG